MKKKTLKQKRVNAIDLLAAALTFEQAWTKDQRKAYNRAIRWARKEAPAAERPDMMATEF